MSVLGVKVGKWLEILCAEPSTITHTAIAAKWVIVYCYAQLCILRIIHTDFPV